MSEPTYPVFYGTQRMTLAQLKARFEQRCHPMVWRRAEALIVWGRGRWGIGGGLRLVQPDKPGFAPAGMSFHELQKFASGIEAYSAFDLVVTNTPGAKHRSPTWTEARELEQFGLWAFISGEPWHGQAFIIGPNGERTQIRGWRTWVEAGRPDPDFFPLPGQPVIPPKPPLAPTLPYNPPTDWWLFPLDPAKPTLRNGDVDREVIGHVRYLQDAIWFGAGGDIHRDGQFGNETERRVIDVQHLFELKEDGIVGPATWEVIDFLVALVLDPNHGQPEPEPENTGVTSVSPCLYYVRYGDSPWTTGEIVYGSSALGVRNLEPELFRAPYVHIPIPAVKGLSTVVRAGEGAIAVVKRMTGSKDDLDVFYDWNGGPERTLHEGDVVHVPV